MDHEETEKKQEREHQLLQRSKVVGDVTFLIRGMMQLQVKLSQRGDGRVRKLVSKLTKAGAAISYKACERVGIEKNEASKLMETIFDETEAALANDGNVEDADASSVEQEQQVIRLRGALGDVHADLDDTRAELENARAVIAESAATIASLNAAAAEADVLRQQLDRERELRRCAQNDVDEVDSKRRAERRRNDELEAELRKARQDSALSADATLVTTLTARLDKVTRERDALRSSEKSTAEQTQALHRKISLLKARNQNASTRRSALTESTSVEDSFDDHSAMNSNEDDSESGENGSYDEESDDFQPRDGESEDGSNKERSADDDFPADMHRNLNAYQERAENKKKRVEITPWSGVDLSWSVLLGTLVQIITWSYEAGDEERPLSRYKSFHSTAVALTAFFIAFGVTHVTGDIPLTSGEEEQVKTNIDVIVAKLKKKCGEDINIMHGSADKLAKAAKDHVPSLWTKLDNVKRSSKNIWDDDDRAGREKDKRRNMHQGQKELYEKLGLSFEKTNKKE